MSTTSKNDYTLDMGWTRVDSCLDLFRGQGSKMNHVNTRLILGSSLLNLVPSMHELKHGSGSCRFGPRST